MPDKELTVAQRSTLLTLMIRASAVPATFLTNTVKISLKPAARNDLRDRGFITVVEKPRIVLELTEKGWGRAIEELDADVPPRGGALGGTLYLLLHFLRGYLDQNDLSAADLFAVRAPASPSDLETQIRKTYGELAPRAGAYVMLEDLRAGLGGTAQADVDTVLVQLDRAQKIHLVPESNQKVLTAGQRAAAIRIGNQDMHLLAIRS